MRHSYEQQLNANSHQLQANTIQQTSTGDKDTQLNTHEAASGTDFVVNITDLMSFILNAN